jgi:predicted ATPase
MNSMSSSLLPANFQATRDDTSTTNPASFRSNVSNWTHDFEETSEDLTLGSKGSTFSKPIFPRNPSLHRIGERLKGLTVNKLQFASLGLYGRSQEIEKLKETFDCSVKSQSRQLLLITGESGSGKSSLALELEKTVQRASGFFIRGKFDLEQRDEPYAGIVAACFQLCEDILALKELESLSVSSSYKREERKTNNWKFSFADMKTRLQEALGPEAQLLARMIPNLWQIVGGELPIISADGDKNSSNGNNNTGYYAEARDRFNFAFRRFMRAISSFGPLVLTLDDLQWADLPSLELFETLITDKENQAMMIIGLYRSDEVNDEHLLSKTIGQIEEYVCREGGVAIARIALGNLEVEHVNQILVDLMSSDVSKTLELAECVHRKTSGNAFFMVSFLRFLQEQDLVKFNFGSLKWTWDVDEIKLCAEATPNVVNLMKAKLGKLPNDVIEMLPLIASIGSTFQFAVFQLVVKYFNETLRVPQDKEHTEGDSIVISPIDVLSICEEAGLIEECRNDIYRWIHDKIQEAALSLVSREALSSPQSQLGEFLRNNLTSDRFETSLFITVNLLNKGASSIPLGDPKRIDLARLNLRAGQKAFSASASISASGYFGKGIGLLPEDHWLSEYSLSLDLFSTAAEAAFCLGDFELTRTFCDPILEQKHRPLLDRRRAYDVLLYLKHAQNLTRDCELLCLELLADLGCHFPKRGLELFALVGIMRTQASSKKRTLDEISQLKPMTEESKIWAMNLLDKLAGYSYITESGLLPLAILKGLRWTLAYGVSEFSPPMFALVGFILTGVLGDFKGGKVYLDYALALLRRTDSRRVESRTLFLVHWFGLHWIAPLESCLKPFLLGYQCGMRMGDTENAMWNIHCYTESAFHTGVSLESVAADCQVYCSQMRDVQQLQHVDYTLPLWQLALNLMGESSNTFVLTGRAMDEAEVLKKVERSPIAGFGPQVNRYRAYAAFFFGEYEIYIELMLGLSNIEKVLPGTFMLCPLYFHNALACFSMAHKTKQSKYRKLAKKFTRKINQWVKKGNPNVTHHESLLEAELAALNGNWIVARTKYDVAIVLAGRRGFTHEQALAHERFAETCLRQGDIDDAMYHFNKAITLYEEWGAAAKVRHLRDMHTKLLSPPSEILLG